MTYGTRRFHKASPIIPILSQINPIPRIAIYFLKIHSILSSQPHLGAHVKILKALLSSPIQGRCPADLLYLITMTVLGEWCTCICIQANSKSTRRFALKNITPTYVKLESFAVSSTFCYAKSTCLKLRLP